MAAMNKGMNLPAIQRIMAEFDKENGTMDLKETMMSDAVDDVMDTEVEEEEEEGDKILKEVLDEIGVDLSHQVCLLHERISYAEANNCVENTAVGIPFPQLVEAPSSSLYSSPLANTKQAVAIGGEAEGPSAPGRSGGEDLGGSGLSDDDALQARLDALRRG